MTQRLPPSLTPLAPALTALLRGVEPVAPVERPLGDALGCIAAEMPPLPACPPQDIAAIDGWALRAGDLVGASSYSPVPLAASPAWVEAGEAMPAGCDCVLDAAAIDTAGPVFEVLAEAVPGQGVRRAGGDRAADTPVVGAGRVIAATDLLLARMAGVETLRVRRPRLRLVNAPGGTAALAMIADFARAAGADVAVVQAKARDAAAIADALDASVCDLLLTVGGSGNGHHDAAVTALARRGEVLAHGLALQPGRTAALGTIASVPAIALPGSPDQALAAWLVLARPVLDRLSVRVPLRPLRRPLARKMTSAVGIADIALLAEDRSAWLPLAVGELPLRIVARADAWLLIPGDSEGFAAGAAVDAYLMRE